MYRRAFSTLGCAELDLEAALRLAADFRLDSVELRGLGGSLDLPAYFTQSFGKPAELKRWMRDQPVGICALGSSFRLMGASAVDRAALLEYLPWAEALGAPYLRVFDGSSTAGAIDWTEAEATWNWWREVRIQAGGSVDLIVETHDTLLTAEKIGNLMRRLPAVKILWDTHHTWKQGGESPAATWKVIQAAVAHLHVKDSPPSPGQNAAAFQYACPGQGAYPMAELRSVVAGTFQGTMSLEWERFWIKSLPPLTTALKSAAALSWW